MAFVIISEFMDLDAVDSLKEGFDVLYDPQLVDDPAKLLSVIKDADALIVRNRTQVTADVLQAAPNLKVVGRLGVGLDNIDLETAKSRNVKVCPASGANDLPVAEYVISTAMQLLRTSYCSNDQMIKGEWPRQALIGYEFSGKVMGLVGYGGIAQEVTKRAIALGMSVAAFDPYKDENDTAFQMAQRCATIDELLAVADVVSLHVPLTEGTRGLIGAAEIEKMGERSVLINTARGGVVDETALAEALREKKIAGAALDVFETEPLTEKSAAKFSGLANLILTPHIAGVTVEANVRVSAVTAENVRNELMRKA